MKKILMNKLILIPSLILIIVSIILTFVIDLSSLFLSLGVILALITHLLMTLQNDRFDEIMNSDIEKPTFHSGKFSLLWLLLRLLITGVFTVLSMLLAIKFSNHLIISVVLYIVGYMVIKILYIASIFKKEGDNR